MKHSLVLILIFAIASLVAVAADPEFKGSIPEPLPEPLKCQSLVVLPNSGLIFTGGEPAKEKSYLWTPDSKGWKAIEQPRMYGELQVSPSNANELLIDGREGFISTDGGKTWRQVFPQFITIDGNRVQIGRAGWSIQRPGILLLIQSKYDSAVGVFELDPSTGKITPYSKIEQSISRYEYFGKKHFGWCGAYDGTWSDLERRNLLKCVVSEDDGRTWNPILPAQSPWALHASAQEQVKQLVPLSVADYGPSPVKPRPAVMWAVDFAGIAICRFQSVTRPLVPAQKTLFTSADRGMTWIPAVLDKRTNDARTLFAESPFVIKDPEGKPIIDPNKDLQFEFDPKTQRIFVGQAGEWFVTTLTDHKWHRINHIPE